MDLKAFRKGSDPVSDVPPGPHAGHAVETKGLFSVDMADASVGMNAPQDSRMEHVRHANVGDV
jgi:hypothetical protein